MKKEEFIQKLEEVKNHCYYKGGVMDAIYYLCKGYDETENKGFKKALDYDMAFSIVELLIGCYDDEDFLNWLVKQEFNIFNHFEDADFDFLEDYDSMEEMKEKSKAFYEGELDCLLYNKEKGIYCISW